MNMVGAALLTSLLAAACSKQHRLLRKNVFPPALQCENFMGGIGERCTKISGTCRYVGRAAQKEEMSLCKLQGLGWSVWKMRCQKIEGVPAEGKLFAITGSNTGWASHK